MLLLGVGSDYRERVRAQILLSLEFHHIIGTTFFCAFLWRNSKELPNLAPVISNEAYKKIEEALADGNLLEVDRLLEAAQREGSGDARLLYLKGRARMKESRWGDAISAFLQAEQIDPSGPARESREMLDDIMAFFNKDMYNQ